LPSDLGERVPLLRAIDLSDTGIVRIPHTLRETSLERLSVRGATSAQSFLSTILSLKALRFLDLRDCNLDYIPPEIDSLRHLEELRVAGNRLRGLPLELTKLSRLRVLDVARNNGMNIPPELRDAVTDPTTVLRNVQARHRRGLNEAKVLLVGESGNGKTSLSRQLRGLEINAAEPATDGIDISATVFAATGGAPRVNLWDFGGQEILHATHQFFMTRRSLYLLVLNCRHSDEQNRVEYWLKMIETLGGAPPTLVVGNHADEQPLDIDQRRLSEKYPFIRGFVEASCWTGDGIDELRDRLALEIWRLPNIRDRVSEAWFSVKREVEEFAAESDFISRTEYSEICARSGITEAIEQSNLLAVLNELGVVVNFEEDPRLEDTAILNPRWVTEGVYTILRLDEVRERGGVLDRLDLENAFELNRRYPVSKRMFVIDVMRRFELCFPIDDDEQRFLLPDLLPRESRAVGNWSGALCFRYQYDVLPSGVLSRLLVRTHHLLADGACWRSGMVLRSGDALALIVAESEDRQLTIRVLGADAAQLLLLIRDALNRIHGLFPGLRVRQFVTDDPESTPFVSYQELLQMAEVGFRTFLVPGKLERRSIAELLRRIDPRGSPLPEIALRDNTAEWIASEGRTGPIENPAEFFPRDRDRAPGLMSIVGAVLLLVAGFSASAVVTPNTAILVVAGASLTAGMAALVVFALLHGRLDPTTFVEALRVVVRSRDRSEPPPDDEE